MTQERAKEILEGIARTPFSWQNSAGVNALFRPGERAEVMKKWDTMPGYTCFADALMRIARGE